MRIALATSALAALLPIIAANSPAPCSTYEQVRGGKIESLEILEASGLAASHVHQGVLWTHNDSGDGARLFAIDLDGALLATLTLEGVNARDWEDLAIAPCGKEDPRECLYIGDIGNNSEARTDLSILRVPEPLEIGTPQNPAVLTAEPLSITPFAYPFTQDPPLIPDAEALLVDRTTGKILIATKESRRTRLVLLEHLDASPKLIGELPLRFVTAGDMRPDGKRMVLREYTSFFEYEVDALASPFRVDDTIVARRGISYEIQGEAVAYSSPDGERIYTLPEGKNVAVSIFDCAPTVLEPEVSDMSGGGGDMSSTVELDSAPDALDMSPPPPDMSSVEQDMARDEVDGPSPSEEGCATSPARPRWPSLWIGLFCLCILLGAWRPIKESWRRT